ncbi:MAG: prolyl oligopeptidase family serine peptidase [Rhodobacteraceae bacterium]|nr:prolyl oligopeptidase family serine peptidase [Paracoccaceae bacterium]
MQTDPGLDGPSLAPLTGGPARKLVLLLHGYGADGDDLIALAREWQADLPEAAFVAPNAPSYLPGFTVSGRQWFPLDQRNPAEYRIGAEAAAPDIDRFIGVHLTQLGLNYCDLALVGFSQGTMMALQVGLHLKQAPAAIIGYSGLLPGLDRLGPLHSATPPNVLLVHGSDDDVVESYHSQAAFERLSELGIPTQIKICPDVGHWIDAEGLALGASFLRKTLAV